MVWEKKNKDKLGLGKDDEISHGPVDRDYTEEDLKSLEAGRRYNAYVTLNTVMDYEDFFKLWSEEAELGSCWCAVQVSDTDEYDTNFVLENIGFCSVPNVSTEIHWDEEKYPNLCLSSLAGSESNLSNEEYAKEHLISMLRYMENNREIYEMMEPDGMDYDFGTMAEYVEKKGVKVYGLYIRADKESLLKLFEKEEVYSIYTMSRRY